MLHFWKVEEGPETGSMGRPVHRIIMVKVQPEIDEASDSRLAVNYDMRFWQVPSPWPDKELGNGVIQLVHPVTGLVVKGDGFVDGISEIHLPLHQVLPTRRQRILKISLFIVQLETLIYLIAMGRLMRYNRFSGHAQYSCNRNYSHFDS